MVIIYIYIITGESSFIRNLQFHTEVSIPGEKMEYRQTLSIISFELIIDGVYGWHYIDFL